MPIQSYIIRSRWIAPISAPVIENAFVAIENGRIVEVGDASSLTRSADLDLGDAVLLPGLINAHTHLELSNQTMGESPRSFGEWLWRLIERRIQLGNTLDDDIAAAARLGAEESIRFGVTCVGDITRECGVTRAALQDSPLRMVSFGEVQAMAMRRGLLEERLEAAIDQVCETERMVVGVSPHAPFTVEPDAYCRIIEEASTRSLRLCTHLSESLEEREFLAFGTGPLRALWDKLGTWDDRVPLVPGGPFQLAHDCGLLEIPSLLAHVNYANDDEIAMLASGKASVVLCPRTHHYFRHAPHRWREMMARGINVCVGTDSKASSPDLNVVDDLRLLHKQAPEVEPAVLWDMVTTNAAMALRLPGIGAIEEGYAADLVAFSVKTDDPLREVLETSILPSHVWIAGDCQIPSPGMPKEG